VWLARLANEKRSWEQEGKSETEAKSSGKSVTTSERVSQNWLLPPNEYRARMLKRMVGFVTDSHVTDSHSKEVQVPSQDKGHKKFKQDAETYQGYRMFRKLVLPTGRPGTFSSKFSKPVEAVLSSPVESVLSTNNPYHLNDHHDNPVESLLSTSNSYNLNDHHDNPVESLLSTSNSYNLNDHHGQSIEHTVFTWFLVFVVVVVTLLLFCTALVSLLVKMRDFYYYLKYGEAVRDASYGKVHVGNGGPIGVQAADQGGRE
jgi:hypothetical protein